MIKQIYSLLIFLLVIAGCNSQPKDSITKIQMSLSAFGVESDDFPSINVDIDFAKMTGKCVKSYYNPAYKDSTYFLNDKELKNILTIISNSDLSKIKKDYNAAKTDQPSSTTIIYTIKNKFVFNDYGLVGEAPLNELYKIVYKY